jgi:hypothetical protein
MNSKLCKGLRKILFKNTHGSEERSKRAWVVLQDKSMVSGKTFNILLCLDPRASYRYAKKQYKSGTSEEKRLWRRELKNAIKKIKDVPRGNLEISDRKPSRLGYPVPMQQIG